MYATELMVLVPKSSNRPDPAARSSRRNLKAPVEVCASQEARSCHQTTKNCDNCTRPVNLDASAPLKTEGLRIATARNRDLSDFLKRGYKSVSELKNRLVLSSRLLVHTCYAPLSLPIDRGGMRTDGAGAL